MIYAAMNATCRKSRPDSGVDYLAERQLRFAVAILSGDCDGVDRLTRRLVTAANDYYCSGDAGLWHFSFRSACAVSAARHVYAEIGSLLVKRGSRAWDQRTYITGARKIWVVLRGVLSLLRSAPARLFQPWSAGALRTIWKYSNVQ
jgi:phytoene/squalene synthetase